MRVLRILAITALLLPACSCVPIPSFNPLWDEQHAAFETRLLGDWVNPDSGDEGCLSFAQLPGNQYLMTLAEKDAKSERVKLSRFTAKLVLLDRRFFLDCIINDAAFDVLTKAEAYQSLVPMHFFVRLELDGDALKLFYLDDEKLEKRVRQKRISLPLLKRNDLIMLTADTVIIQQFLHRYAEDEDLWDACDALHRRTR